MTPPCPVPLWVRQGTVSTMVKDRAPDAASELILRFCCCCCCCWCCCCCCISMLLPFWLELHRTLDQEEMNLDINPAFASSFPSRSRLRLFSVSLCYSSLVCTDCPRFPYHTPLYFLYLFLTYIISLVRSPSHLPCAL